MMDARVQLNFAEAAGALEEPAQLLNHRQRRQFVMLGAGDVEFALGLGQ